jgi:diguanylate cyclase (GGDEF)-like protein
LLLILAGIGDRLTGDDLAFTLIYLIPVAVASWWIGRTGGLLAAAGATISSVAISRAHLLTLSPLVQAGNALTEAGVFGTVALLLAALRGRIEIESRLARTDPLTGIRNRRAFIDAVEQQIARAGRDHRPFTIGLLDLDGFKHLNDTHGHPAGDEALVAVSSILSRRLRAMDAVARLGGDEFAVLLPETTDRDAAAALTDLVRLVAAAGEERGWGLGLSIGAVTFTSPPEGLDEALRHPDRLLYDAKRAGKGCVHLGTWPHPPSSARSA